MKSTRFVSLLRSQSALKNIRFYSTEALAVRYHKNAHPTSTGTLVTEKIELPAVGTNDVLVKMIAAPINPADLNMIEGTYAIKPTLPAIGGNEGVGVVEKVGAGVKNLKVGQYVIPAKPGFGTWRTHAVANENDFDVVPNDIPPEYAAILSVNPCTALRLLEDFVSLKPGDVIIQNAANSMVGLAVIQIAKARGVKTINIIRERPDSANTIERLKKLGGDIVVTENYAVTPAMTQLISDLPKPRLGLNAVGGSSVATLSKLVADGSTIVTYGGMSKKPAVVSTGALIFKDITYKGFWLSKWLETHSKEERAAMFETLVPMIRNKQLVLFSERYSFSEFNAALDEATSAYRNRKVILRMDQ